MNLAPVSLPLPATTTDANGRAQLPLDLTQYDAGIYRLNVLAEGFEAGGGRSVKAQASVMLSPLAHLIGYKPDGDLSFVDKDAVRHVTFQALDSDARAVALPDLTLSIVEQAYVSTLVKRPNGTFAYQSIVKETVRSSQPFAVPADGVAYALPTNTSGTFVVQLADASGLVYSKVPYTVAGARNLAGNLERNAELSLALNADSFDPGDEIRLEVTAPYAGTGLITIERDRVYAHRWFRSDTNTSVQTIRVPESLEGNAYVNVAFIRDLQSPEIYVSP